jgi:hypothetical protein
VDFDAIDRSLYEDLRSIGKAALVNRDTRPALE